ncbi:hypothetical protein [Microbacterium sp.]|uniref:hypothetical protein n=1 Tax=Microbacterium sp. TaxID=51671 RepID=UPI0037354A54
MIVENGLHLSGQLAFPMQVNCSFVGADDQAREAARSPINVRDNADIPVVGVSTEVSEEKIDFLRSVISCPRRSIPRVVSVDARTGSIAELGRRRSRTEHEHRECGDRKTRDNF